MLLKFCVLSEQGLDHRHVATVVLLLASRRNIPIPSIPILSEILKRLLVLHQVIMQILIAGVTVAGKSARIVTDKQERSLTIGNAIREIREIRG